MSEYETAERAREQLLAARVMVPATRRDLALAPDGNPWERVAELRHRACRTRVHLLGQTYLCYLTACPGKWSADEVVAMSERTFAEVFGVSPVVRSEDLPVWRTELVGDRRGGYTRTRLQTPEEAAEYFRRWLVAMRGRWH